MKTRGLAERIAKLKGLEFNIELRERLGWSTQEYIEAVTGKTRLTEKQAADLSQTLGGTPESWLEMNV